MMELLILQGELQSSDEDKDGWIEHDGNNGGAEGDVYYTMSDESRSTMSDESRSSNKNSDDDVDETTAQPMVIQEDHKIKVKFENKL